MSKQLTVRFRPFLLCQKCIYPKPQEASVIYPNNFRPLFFTLLCNRTFSRLSALNLLYLEKKKSSPSTRVSEPNFRTGQVCAVGFPMAATATYPPPPPYYKLYKDYIQNPTSAPEPPPPIEGTYVLLGANYNTDDVLPSLEEQGVRQLYPTGPNIDFKNELRSLNRDLQLHILELADVLIERPSQYARRVEDISLIFKNLHHLLNSLRPHQGRATLIHLLESQIQRRKQAVEDIKRRREEAQKLLKEALGTLDGH